jgi:hypothetical protein
MVTKIQEPYCTSDGDFVKENKQVQCGPYSFGAGYGKVSGFCENSNEP